MSRATQKEATRASIMKLAKELFEEDGFEATTIRELAARLGMSTGAIFANFSGKEELYLAVMGHEVITPEAGVALRQMLADLVEDLDKIVADHHPDTGSSVVRTIRDLESLAHARELAGIMEPRQKAA